MPNTQVKDKLITLEELGAAYNSITPANIGSVAMTGNTESTPIKNPTADTKTALYIRTTKSSGGLGFVCDHEGGNIVITGPNGEGSFEIDAYNNTKLRCYTQQSGNYQAFSFNGLTGALEAEGGFEGNATTATGVKDAGDSSNTITIRWRGNGVDATTYLPMYDSNGNLVPVTTDSFGAKLGVKRDLISSSINITTDIPLDLSAYSRIECDFYAFGNLGHFVLQEKDKWYCLSFSTEDTATSNNSYMYSIRAKYTDNGIEVNYCGFKNLSTGAWTNRIGNNDYRLRNIYGYI